MKGFFRALDREPDGEQKFDQDPVTQWPVWHTHSGQKRERVKEGAIRYGPLTSKDRWFSSILNGPPWKWGSSPTHLYQPFFQISLLSLASLTLSCVDERLIDSTEKTPAYSIYLKPNPFRRTMNPSLVDLTWWMGGFSQTSQGDGWKNPRKKTAQDSDWPPCHCECSRSPSCSSPFDGKFEIIFEWRKEKS